MMQMNWSVILNLVLLGGVIVAMIKMIKTRRTHAAKAKVPSLNVNAAPQAEVSSFDDIIAVRKVAPEISPTSPTLTPMHAPFMRPSHGTSSEEKMLMGHPQKPIHVTLMPDNAEGLTSAADVRKVENNVRDVKDTVSVMMFLLAKDQRQLAGYELLQTVLAAGLRFGEGQIFHRHQHLNGQGPVMCSLAAATSSGIFDLHHIGAFTVRGLCLFMQASGNTTIDAERFEIMLSTAHLLSEGLDTHLLDDRQQSLSDASIKRYQKMLGLTEERMLHDMA